MVFLLDFKFSDEVALKLEQAKSSDCFCWQVGWDLRKMLAALAQLPGSEVQLLLKKRPRDVSGRGPNKSLPATPKMTRRRLLEPNPNPKPITPEPSSLMRCSRTSGSSSSAADPESPTVLRMLVPAPQPRKARLRSNSYTGIPSTSAADDPSDRKRYTSQC